MRSNRVLFVDDDILNQWLLTDSLTAAKFVVTGLCRGAQALRMLEGGRKFDLLLTDFVLPDGMSGFELAEHWRRLRPGCPVIYTSALSQMAIGALGDDEGFIRRYAAPADLLKLVGLLLEESRLPLLKTVSRPLHLIH